MLAYCVVYNGPFPQFLHPKFYAILGQGVGNVKFTISDITDLDLRAKYEKVHEDSFYVFFFKIY